VWPSDHPSAAKIDPLLKQTATQWAGDHLVRQDVPAGQWKVAAVESRLLAQWDVDHPVRQDVPAWPWLKRANGPNACRNMV